MKDLMKLNKTTRLTVVLIALLAAGCGKTYDFELARLAEICGGYDKIKSVWIDLTTARAYCKDGSFVTVKD